jgi:hypothetical protein
VVERAVFLVAHSDEQTVVEIAAAKDRSAVGREKLAEILHQGDPLSNDV